MTRRELARRTMFAVGAELAPRGDSFAVSAPAEPQATEYVARFILETRFRDMGESDVMDEVAAKFSDCAVAARWPEAKTKAGGDGGKN